MPPLGRGGTCGWRRKVFHCLQLTQIFRNPRSLDTIHLQIPSLAPLEMRKVQLRSQQLLGDDKMAKAIRRVALLLTFSLLVLTSTVGVASSQAGNGKYDTDGDRLIEVSNLEQLDAIRFLRVWNPRLLCEPGAARPRRPTLSRRGFRRFPRKSVASESPYSDCFSRNGLRCLRARCGLD